MTARISRGASRQRTAAIRLDVLRLALYLAATATIAWPVIADEPTDAALQAAQAAALQAAAQRAAASTPPTPSTLSSTKSTPSTPCAAKQAYEDAVKRVQAAKQKAEAVKQPDAPRPKSTAGELRDALSKIEAHPDYQNLLKYEEEREAYLKKSAAIREAIRQVKTKKLALEKQIAVLNDSVDELDHNQQLTPENRQAVGSLRTRLASGAEQVAQQMPGVVLDSLDGAKKAQRLADAQDYNDFTNATIEELRDDIKRRIADGEGDTEQGKATIKALQDKQQKEKDRVRRRVQQTIADWIDDKGKLTKLGPLAALAVQLEEKQKELKEKQAAFHALMEEENNLFAKESDLDMEETEKRRQLLTIVRMIGELKKELKAAEQWEPLDQATKELSATEDELDQARKLYDDAIKLKDQALADAKAQANLANTGEFMQAEEKRITREVRVEYALKWRNESHQTKEIEARLLGERQIEFSARIYAARQSESRRLLALIDGLENSKCFPDVKDFIAELRTKSSKVLAGNGAGIGFDPRDEIKFPANIGLGDDNEQSGTEQKGTFSVKSSQWTSTGIQLKKGQKFKVAATGTFKFKEYPFSESGPNGDPNWGFGSLKGLIGKQFIELGANYEGTATEDGELKLAATHSHYYKEDMSHPDDQNVTGGYTVTVTAYGSRTTGGTSNQGELVPTAMADRASNLDDKGRAAALFKKAKTIPDLPGQREQALAAYREAIRLDPANAEYHYVFGAYQLNRRVYPEAEEHLRKAAQLEPKRGRAHMELAHLFGLQDKNDRVESAYREAIRREPNNHEYYQPLAYILLQNKKYKEAEPMFAKAFADKSRQGDLHLHLAQIRWNQGRREDARREFNTATRLGFTSGYDRWVYPNGQHVFTIFHGLGWKYKK